MSLGSVYTHVCVSLLVNKLLDWGKLLYDPRVVEASGIPILGHSSHRAGGTQAMRSEQVIEHKLIIDRSQLMLIKLRSGRPCKTLAFSTFSSTPIGVKTLLLKKAFQTTERGFSSHCTCTEWIIREEPGRQWWTLGLSIYLSVYLSSFYLMVGLSIYPNDSTPFYSCPCVPAHVCASQKKGTINQVDLDAYQQEIKQQ